MSNKIGFWPVFALVMGSQIGSGVFMSPANLAPFGAISLLGWAISGAGAIMLALVFANLCSRFPRTGGPHVYVEETFGRFFGFFTGWTYWVVSWVSSIAVITASIGYLSPILGQHSPLFHLSLEILLLLLITGVNLRGVKVAGIVEFFLTNLKLIPLLIVPIIALFFFDTNNFFTSETVSQLSLPKALNYVTLLTLWGFIGLESATTPAGSIENPGKTIPRAVILGTLCVLVIYALNSVAIMGVVPGEMLSQSKAPYGEAALHMFGGSWHLLIALIASIVCIGTLNAWVLTSGQIALGLAQDGLMPSFFAKRNRFGAPYGSLIVCCMGILPLLILTHSDNLAQKINVIVDISVTSFLFVYGICSLAYLRVLYTQKTQASLWQWTYGVLALFFCLWIILSTNWNTLLVASLFTITGIPIYFLQRHRIKGLWMQTAKK